MANTDQTVVEGAVYAGYTLKMVRLLKTKLFDEITWINCINNKCLNGSKSVHIIIPLQFYSY